MTEALEPAGWTACGTRCQCMCHRNPDVRHSMACCSSEKRDTPMTKSILSEQREADERLCERLEYLSTDQDSAYEAKIIAEAATRIRALSADLQEACHERDGLLVPEWQPIETAPKDGTVIWLAKEGHMRLGLWTNGAEHENHGTKDGGWIDWVNAHGTGPRGLRFAPTHWMPLPTPPGEK